MIREGQVQGVLEMRLLERVDVVSPFGLASPVSFGRLRMRVLPAEESGSRVRTLAGMAHPSSDVLVGFSTLR